MNKPITQKKERKPRKPRKIDVFDQDNAWKTFVTANISDTIEALKLELHAMMDHSVPPEFLEQEMVNVMRGKYKVKNKDKKTDKLIKIRLLNGEDHYLYLHLEFQSQFLTKIQKNWKRQIICLALLCLLQNTPLILRGMTKSG